MAIEYKKSLAVFTEFVGVEEAENLLQWLLKNPKGKILPPASIFTRQTCKC
jgi:hypothetical protein